MKTRWLKVVRIVVTAILVALLFLELLPKLHPTGAVDVGRTGCRKYLQDLCRHVNSKAVASPGATFAELASDFRAPGYTHAQIVALNKIGWRTHYGAGVHYGRVLVLVGAILLVQMAGRGLRRPLLLCGAGLAIVMLLTGAALQSYRLQVALFGPSRVGDVSNEYVIVPGVPASVGDASVIVAYCRHAHVDIRMALFGNGAVRRVEEKDLRLALGREP